MVSQSFTIFHVFLQTRTFSYQNRCSFSFVINFNVHHAVTVFLYDIFNYVLFILQVLRIMLTCCSCKREKVCVINDKF